MMKKKSRLRLCFSVSALIMLGAAFCFSTGNFFGGNGGAATAAQGTRSDSTVHVGDILNGMPVAATGGSGQSISATNLTLLIAACVIVSIGIAAIIREIVLVRYYGQKEEKRDGQLAGNKRAAVSDSLVVSR